MAGLSKPQLERLHRVQSGWVEQGELFARPRKRLITILLTQRWLDTPQPWPWFNDSWTLASWSME